MFCLFFYMHAFPFPILTVVLLNQICVICRSFKQFMSRQLLSYFQLLLLSFTKVSYFLILLIIPLRAKKKLPSFLSFIDSCKNVNRSKLLLAEEFICFISCYPTLFEIVFLPYMRGLVVCVFGSLFLSISLSLV